MMAIVIVSIKMNCSQVSTKSLNDLGWNILSHSFAQAVYQAHYSVTSDLLIFQNFNFILDTISLYNLHNLLEHCIITVSLCQWILSAVCLFHKEYQEVNLHDQL
jgi:hypothetical protein